MKTKEEETTVGAGDEKVRAALAPAALEERILNTLAEAGCDGMEPEDLIDEVFLGIDDDDEPEDDFIEEVNEAIGSLIARGLARPIRDDDGEERALALTHKEMARRLVHESVVPITEHCSAALTSVLDDPRQVKALEAEFERLLAGTEATPRPSEDRAPSVDSEPWLIVGARYACRSRGVVAVAQGINTWVHPESQCPLYRPGSSLGRGYVRSVETEVAVDTARATIDVAALRSLAKRASDEEAAFWGYSESVRAMVGSLASAVGHLADAFEWEEAFVKAILNREPRDNLISRLTAQRDAAHEAGVAEERDRRDPTIERLQSERDADRAAFETAREGLEGDKAKLAEDLDRARRLAAARKDDLADMTRWRDETLKMVAEYDVGAAELRVRIDQLTKERDEALTAKGIATKSAETERAENERLAAEVATLKAEAAQRVAVADQAMRHFMEGAPEGMAEEVGYVPQHKTGEG